MPSFGLTADLKHLTALDDDWKVDLHPAKFVGGEFQETPKFLIMHYTAGRSFDSTAKAFASPQGAEKAKKKSIHLLVDRKANIYQMCPFDRVAWHAGGESSWTDHAHGFKTYQRMNFSSIGIEFCNYGPLTKVGSSFKTWFGRVVDPEEVAEVNPANSETFGIRYWHAYSEEQLEAATELANTICNGFEMHDVIGHSDVCPGRKQDPGPLFPLNHIRAAVFGRE